MVKEINEPSHIGPQITSKVDTHLETSLKDLHVTLTKIEYLINKKSLNLKDLEYLLKDDNKINLSGNLTELKNISNVGISKKIETEFNPLKSSLENLDSLIKSTDFSKIDSSTISQLSDLIKQCKDGQLSTLKIVNPNSRNITEDDNHELTDLKNSLVTQTKKTNLSPSPYVAKNESLLEESSKSKTKKAKLEEVSDTKLKSKDIPIQYPIYVQAFKGDISDITTAVEDKDPQISDFVIPQFTEDFRTFSLDPFSNPLLDQDLVKPVIDKISTLIRSDPYSESALAYSKRQNGLIDYYQSRTILDQLTNPTDPQPTFSTLKKGLADSINNFYQDIANNPISNLSESDRKALNELETLLYTVNNWETVPDKTEIDASVSVIRDALRSLAP